MDASTNLHADFCHMVRMASSPAKCDRETRVSRTRVGRQGLAQLSLRWKGGGAVRSPVRKHAEGMGERGGRGMQRRAVAGAHASRGPVPITGSLECHRNTQEPGRCQHYWRPATVIVALRSGYCCFYFQLKRPPASADRIRDVVVDLQSGCCCFCCRCCCCSELLQGLPVKAATVHLLGLLEALEDALRRA